MKTAQYSLILRILHWLIALIILLNFLVGIVMDEFKNSLKESLINNHKSFGCLLLALVILRIVVRICTKAPAYADNMSPLLKKIAHITHVLLYALMLFVPLSGASMVLLAGRKLEVFGMAVPKFLEKNESLANSFYDLHTILPYVLISLVGLHVAAAMKHLLINKDRVFSRISIFKAR